MAHVLPLDIDCPAVESWDAELDKLAERLTAQKRDADFAQLAENATQHFAIAHRTVCDHCTSLGNAPDDILFG